MPPEAEEWSPVKNEAKARKQEVGVLFYIDDQGYSSVIAIFAEANPARELAKRLGFAYHAVAWEVV